MPGDENGLFPNETTPTLPPAPVANTQKFEHAFIKEWLKGMYLCIPCAALIEAVAYLFFQSGKSSPVLPSKHGLSRLQLKTLFIHNIQAFPSSGFLQETRGIYI